MNNQVIYELWDGDKYIGKSPIKEQIMFASDYYKNAKVIKVYLNGEREVIWNSNW